MKRALLVLILALPATGATIQEAAERAASTPPFDRALWFVLVEDERGRVIYQRNADTLAIPASVRKLFSAATVIDCLGTQTRLATELYRDGDDLVIRGGGDPSFGARRYEFTPQTTFAPFVDALRSRGINRVRDLIADVSLFDGVTIPYQWKMGNLTSDDAAVVDALAYEENQIEGFAVASPPFFALLAFRDQLREAGIAVEGSLRTERAPHQWAEKLAAIESPFVGELLVTVLRNSHNLYAEMLYKRVSAGEEPASYTRSREIELDLLAAAQITRDEVRFVDGSGLAPDDLVTAAAMVKILRWMNHPLRRSLTWEVLAQPGIEGTLRRRLLPLADRLRAKTGSVAGVNSLAGIVRGGNGGLRYFAIAVNHHIGRSSDALRLIDGIVEAVADF